MHWNSRSSGGRRSSSVHAALGLAVWLGGFGGCATGPGPGPTQEFPGGPSTAANSGPPARVESAVVLPPEGVAPSPSLAPSPGATIVTPANTRVGRVALVNGSARYVVVTYPFGELPIRDATLNVFRNGLKVAEVKVTGLSRDINAAADIVAGECQVGDEVREP